MPRVDPLSMDEATERAGSFDWIEDILGFVPNSVLIMARRPELVEGFKAICVAALAPGRVPRELKALIAHVSSRTAGCVYCAAHTGHISDLRGVEAAKFDAVWDYERSELFSDAERAALVLAQSASTVPNAVTDADFVEAKRHWDDDQLVEIMGVIALYGFLNRWNDTLATPLEPDPADFGNARLASAGWRVGKHEA